LQVGKRFIFKSDSVTFKDLTDIYYKAKYSNSTITEQELEAMQESYYDMLNNLKYQHNKREFLYLRYIKMIGLLNVHV